MNLRKSILALMLFGLTPGAMRAQEQAEVKSSQSSITFSGRTDLVSVPVVVRDGKGHAIRGLRQTDSKVLDNGKQQAIVQFSVLSNESGKM